MEVNTEIRNMGENAFKEIKKIIEEYQHSLQQHLPAVELEVTSIIHDRVQNNNTIEGILDTLLSMTDMGVGKIYLLNC